ncbi:glycoside hydrolase [Wallemia mellicola]|nr:glycoside hydrolase [Wallemia mellicola]
MVTLLEALREVTTIDLDAIDVDVATKFSPVQDMTCNQFLVQATLTMPQHAHVLAFAVDEAFRLSNALGVDEKDTISFEQLVVDIASVNIIKEVKPKLHPQGLVLLQTCCSKLDVINEIVNHCEQIVKIFDIYGISSKECCIKVPATVNGLKACKILTKRNIKTLATTVFSTSQALAAAEAGCVAISPYLNELDAHFDKKLYTDYSNPVKESPGVQLTHKIQRYYRSAGIKTQVKAASFIAPIDAVSMAGIDAITVGPTILEGLANTQTHILLQINTMRYWLTAAALIASISSINSVSLNSRAISGDNGLEGLRNLDNLNNNIQPFTELQGGPSYNKYEAEDVQPYTETSEAEYPMSASGFNAQATNGKQLIGAYYPDWQTNRLPVNQIDWTNIDYVSYAFGLLSPSTYEITLSAGSDSTLTSLVEAAHAQSPSKKVELSIGGWTGSEPFSEAVSTDANREKLATAIVNAQKKWNLDGIDLDWEYPGLPGAGNPHTGSDSANYLKFLKVLKPQLPSGVTLSAATAVYPFAGPDGKPLADVSGFGEVFDHILIMNYDVFNAAPAPGPNAALKDTCGSSKPGANAEDSIKAWNEAGMPLEKIYLGVPAYGYLHESSAKALVARQTPTVPGADDTNNGQPTTPNNDQPATPTNGQPAAPTDGQPATPTNGASPVTIKNADGTTAKGQVDFDAIVDSGALKRVSATQFDAAGGWTRKWDECSSTPFLYSGSQVLSYDDPESFKLKAQLAKDMGIGGMGGWTLIGDTNQGDLYSALREGLGV